MATRAAIGRAWRSWSGRIIELGVAERAEIPSILEAVPPGPHGPVRPFSAVVLDHPEMGAAWLRDARGLGRRRAVLDDGPARRLSCDLVVNGNLGARPASYVGYVPRRAHVLAGVRYAILRAPFAVAHERARDRRTGPVRSVLVGLGGGDQSSAMDVVVRAARAALPEATIDVVAGAAGGHDGGQGIRVHRDVGADRLIRLMLASDLAVGGGGMSSWERCAVGLPSIAIRLAADQGPVVDALAGAGAVIDGGGVADLSVERLRIQIDAIASRPDRRQALGDRAWGLVDGRGATRVGHAIEGVRLRRARMVDAPLLWRWANDPIVRAMSLDERPIPYPDHLDWLRDVLSDPRRTLLIGWNRAGDLGQIRFDRRTDATVVSISTASAHRGTVGGLLLAAGLRRLRQERPGLSVVAQVKEGNAPSRRLFERAGFVIRSQGDGVLCYVLDTTTSQGSGHGGRVDD